MLLLLAQETTPPPLNILDSVNKALSELLNSLQIIIPGLVGGLVIFIIGCIIAAIIRRVVTTILNKVGLEKAIEKVGLKEMLSGIGLKAPLSAIIGKLIFWALVLMFLMTAVKVVPGLTDIALVLKNIIDYLPTAASAILYGLIGLVIAQLVRGAILTSAESVGLEYARPLANVIYGFLVVVILTLAIGQMGIETELLSKTVQISLAAVGLALSIAIGFGMRGIAQSIASGVYARDLFRPGTIVQWEDRQYRVVGVGATSTRLEDLDSVGFLMIPNVELLGKAVRGQDGEASTSEV